MQGVRRLLWSLTILMLLGCRSILPESTGLTDRLSDVLKRPATQPAGGEAEAALTGAGGNRSIAAPQSRQSLSGRWADNEVLRMVVEQELAGAPPEQREQMLRRLAGADENQAAALLRELRSAEPSAGLATSAATEGETEASSVQQIILTRRPEPGLSFDRRVAQTSAVPSPGRADQMRRPHPPGHGSDRLAAPRPGGGPPPGADITEPISPPIAPAVDEQSAVAVVNVFGAGGETQAALKEIAEASRIGLAGSQPTDEPDTQAEMIARDLDSDDASQAVYWQEDLDKLITLLEAQIAQQKPGRTDDSREHYIRQHVALRMLYLIASRRPEALQSIPGVAHDRQEFWTRMFWALSSIFDEESMPNSTVRAADTVAQLRAAIEQLEPRASLELRGAVFCRQINGFGDFVTFDDEPFAAGQPVLIYTEVRNFQSLAQDDGRYRTVLRSTITIQQQSVSGPVVFKYDLPGSEDRCQSRRQDYFHSYRIHLPETLQPGPYVLTLDVTDGLSGKNGSTTLNFVVR